MRTNHHFRITKYFLLEENFQGIEKEVQAGFIRKAIHPDHPELAIYNYTEKCSFDGHWNLYTKMCRGLVLNTKTREVIISCIPKFFNQGEEYADKVDLADARITLKEDGYMIQYTYHEDYGLIVTSRGSFSSQYSDFVYNLLKDKVTSRTEFAGERISFMLELCKDFPGDESIIVTKHPKDRLVCWAATNVMGEELDLRAISSLLPDYIEVVREFTLEEAKEYLKGEVEGVVARGPLSSIYYPRVKIKTDWFLRMHRLISDCTKKRVWELVKEKIPVNSLEGIPDEFMKQMLEWEKEIQLKVDKMYQDALDKTEECDYLSDKELGLKQPFDPITMKVIWLIRKDKEQQALDFIVKYIGKGLNEDDNQ